MVWRLATAPDFTALRQRFRQECARAFEPDFLPAFLQIVGVMADTEDERWQLTAQALFAAAVLELRDFLDELELEAFSVTAALVDLVVGSLAATVDDTSAEDASAELVRAPSSSPGSWLLPVQSWRSAANMLPPSACCTSRLS